MDGKICQNIKLPTTILSSVQRKIPIRLEDYGTYGFYTFCYMLLILKSFFNETKFNCFNKISIFSYSLLPKILKFGLSNLRLVFSYNDCI